VVVIPIYGKKHVTAEIKRHFLHAAKLKIILPNEKQPRIFEAELPDELKRVLEEINANYFFQMLFTTESTEFTESFNFFSVDFVLSVVNLFVCLIQEKNLWTTQTFVLIPSPSPRPKCASDGNG